MFNIQITFMSHIKYFRSVLYNQDTFDLYFLYVDDWKLF